MQDKKLTVKVNDICIEFDTLKRVRFALFAADSVILTYGGASVG